jgi:hypothetical protein
MSHSTASHTRIITVDDDDLLVQVFSVVVRGSYKCLHLQIQ